MKIMKLVGSMVGGAVGGILAVKALDAISDHFDTDCCDGQTLEEQAAAIDDTGIDPIEVPDTQAQE